MKEMAEWEFDIYALSLPRGHDFGDCPPVNGWQSDDGLACGVITQDANDGSFGLQVLRRRVDHVWTTTAQEHGLASETEARTRLEPLLRAGRPPEPIPPGTPKRPALYDFGGREVSDIFGFLGSPSHQPAAWTLNQLYLALPNPDKNWVSDCQTGNFHTRLWEAQLLASFREQGLLVTQPENTPDFRIENRCGDVAWVEAVTANPSERYNHLHATPASAPKAHKEKFFGPAALRFAKTLGNKLCCRYDQLPHVAGSPFIIAIADFQAPASMVWSREGLIGYLYGQGAEVVDVEGVQTAAPMYATHLVGSSGFPAGLFIDDRHSELSAVIFSNACSIAKLNRVAISGRGAPEGFRYTRIGHFFDRTPGALKGIPFCLDITSEEYRRLWPQGYEPWSAELEVFHNPFANHPVPFDLLPEATHWFDHNGELQCRSYYETSILWSQTLTQDAADRVPSLEDFMAKSEPDT